jgi:UDP-N-acetylglucosamine 2-epimerase (non-hydrolysing)
MGTRPEVIKMAPVVRELSARGDAFEPILCSTGQHREMVAGMLADFGLPVDKNLDLMTENQTLASLSARLFSSVDRFLEEHNPDCLLVQGDTTTVMVASLCAYYRKIAVGHIEAGLRSGRKFEPFPEEVNRRVAGLVADMHFAPTRAAAENLYREGVLPDAVFITGNTVIDSLVETLKKNDQNPPEFTSEIADFTERFPRFILMTGHRRENFGEGFQAICRAVQQLAKKFPETGFLYPVHLNPKVQKPVYALLGAVPNVLLAAPQGYTQFVQLLATCHLVLTDSGGIQEEAPTLGKPVLVMRDVTERPEGVDAGCSRLVGTSERAIVDGVSELLGNPEVYTGMSTVRNPYGDGQAAARIADAMEAFFHRRWANA